MFIEPSPYLLPGDGVRGRGRRLSPLPWPSIQRPSLLFCRSHHSRKTARLHPENLAPTLETRFVAQIPPEAGSPARSAIAADCNTAPGILRCSSASVRGHRIGGRKFPPVSRFDEAFAAGIVIRICRTTHARNHPMLLEDGHVFCADVPRLRHRNVPCWAIQLRAGDARNDLRRPIRTSDTEIQSLISPVDSKGIQQVSSAKRGKVRQNSQRTRTRRNARNETEGEELKGRPG